MDNNEYKKICRTFSFAFEEGHKALKHLDKKSNACAGGKSGYIIKLILADMARESESR